MRGGFRGAPLRFDSGADLSEFWFPRNSARKIGLGPQEPAPHPLILREGGIHASDNPGGVARFFHSCLIPRHFSAGHLAQQQHAARLGVSTALQSYDDAVLHFRIAPQRCFQVFRVDVHSRSRNDDVFLAALEIKISIAIESAQITRAKPSGVHSIARNGAQLAALPGARGNVFSAHQDFAVCIELHFAAFENFADGAAADLERMIYADQRSCLRQTIALNCGESDAPPEQFRIGFKRRAAGDDCPEFPSEAAMNSAKTPHAADHFFVRRRSKVAPKRFEEARGLQVAFDFVLKRFERTRYGNQYGGAFAFDRGNDFGWVERVLKQDSRAEQRRHPHAKKLAENMAERHKIKEAQRMEEALSL